LTSRRDQENRRSDLRIDYPLDAYRTIVDTAHPADESESNDVRQSERALADVQFFARYAMTCGSSLLRADQRTNRATSDTRLMIRVRKSDLARTARGNAWATRDPKKAAGRTTIEPGNLAA
jgi:hypothetical protein